MNTLFLKVYQSIREMTLLETTVTVVGSIEPIALIPQVVKVWQLRSATEFSLFTWGFGVFAGVVWLLYGFETKKIPIIVVSALDLAIIIPLVVAILLYG